MTINPMIEKLMKRIYRDTKNVTFILITSSNKQNVFSKVQSHTNGTSGDHLNLKNLVLAQTYLLLTQQK
jgi:hypothetical protein